MIKVNIFLTNYTADALYGFSKHFLFRWTRLNTKLRVSACKTVNHVTTLNILLYSLFWCNLVPILNCLFFQKGCSPCNQRHSSHFSDTGSWYTCHTSLKSSLLSSCRRRPPPALPSFVGEMWPQAPPVRWRCILFARKRWAEACSHRQSVAE